MTDSTQRGAVLEGMSAASSSTGVEGTQASREYECKLGGSAAKLRLVKKAAQGLSESRLTWSTDDLESVYYDTPDLRLGRRHVTLRVRKKKGRFIQNVKSENDGSGALFARGEWEQEVNSLMPRLDLLPDDALEVLGLVLPGELRETFRTRFTREQTVIVRRAATGAESRIEVAIDKGEVVAVKPAAQAGRGSRAKAMTKVRETIQECEMELLQGDPRDLFEVAVELQQATGLSIVEESKAARGYRLLQAPEIKPVRAAKTPLTPGQTVNQAVAEILRAGTRHMLANESPSIDGKDPEGVHQFRVAVRRMRSMLSVFSKLLDPARVDWLKAELKWIADQFGPARDWDVFIAEILAPPMTAGVEPLAMAKLRAAAEDHRRDAYVQVREALKSARYAALVLKLSAFTETQGWAPQPCPPDHPLAQPISQWAGPILSRAHKKTLRAGEGLENLDVPARHVLRIRVKKLRYTMDFLQALYDSPAKKKYLRALERLQDDFGHLNDVAVAETLLADLTAGEGTADNGDAGSLSAGAAAVMGWHARGLHDSEPHLLEDWGRFTKASPFWRNSD
ncbi:MAG: CYTH and CHAD domain-containing protein [Rhodospirillales bacterium]